MQFRSEISGWRDLGVHPVRRLNGQGNPAPHLSIQFDSHLFSIDTTRPMKRSLEPDAYLITHAHSDHYGKSAMLSSNAVASKQTARALEIRYGRDFMGRTFCVGETIEVNGVEVRTCPTRHAIGASAFRWENESGTSILVTGDVKDYRGLPKADVLIAEANYGDPWDLSCIFDDDLASFWDAMQDRSAFGAYAFGKAQRAVGLLRGMGYSGPIGMDEESIVLTSELMPECGPLVSYGEEADISVVTPFNLGKARQSQKYFLTGRQGNSFSTIRISDHLDFRGIMKMVEHVHPESLIAYHPCGTRTRLFAHHLRQIGMDAISVDEVDNFIK